MNKALAIFEPLIGDWDAVGSHALIPDTVLHGRTTFAWQESDAFIVMRSRIEEAVGVPDGVAVIGSDDKLGTYRMLYYDDRGVSRIMNIAMRDGVFSWWRDEPGFSQRYSFTFSPDRQTMVSEGGLSRDGHS